jgi:hypothetical protein
LPPFPLVAALDRSFDVFFARLPLLGLGETDADLLELRASSRAPAGGSCPSPSRPRRASSGTLDAARGVDELLLPGVNGWQAEQISTWRADFVLRVTNVLPQPHVTVQS